MCCLMAWSSSSLFRFGCVTMTFNTRGANLSSASSGERLWMYPSLNSLSGLPIRDSNLSDIQSKTFTGHSSTHTMLQIRLIRLNWFDRTLETSHVSKDPIRHRHLNYLMLSSWSLMRACTSATILWGWSPLRAVLSAMRKEVSVAVLAPKFPKSHRAIANASNNSFCTG